MLNAAPLSTEQIAVLQLAVAEVATEVGFGMVAIVIEKGEPIRVQKMVDFFFRKRPEHPPPICAGLNE